MSPEPQSVVSTEPVVLYQSIATVICAALLAVGVVVDPTVLGGVLLAVAGLVTQIVAAVKARNRVVPVQQ